MTCKIHLQGQRGPPPQLRLCRCPVKPPLPSTHVGAKRVLLQRNGGAKYKHYFLHTAALGLGGFTKTLTVVKQKAQGHFPLLCPPAGSDQLPKRQIPHPQGLNKQWAQLAEDACTLALRLRPDSSVKPESAHTQPALSLAHIQENMH